MGDMRDLFKAHREHKQERHQLKYSENTERVFDHFGPEGMHWQWNSDKTAMMFREKGKPKVDFFPHTGRWKVGGPKQEVLSGGAGKFQLWYEKQ